MSTKCIFKKTRYTERILQFGWEKKKQLIQNERNNSVQLIFKLSLHTYAKREYFKKTHPLSLLLKRCKYKFVQFLLVSIKEM